PVDPRRPARRPGSAPRARPGTAASAASPCRRDCPVAAFPLRRRAAYQQRPPCLDRSQPLLLVLAPQPLPDGVVERLETRLEAHVEDIAGPRQVDDLLEGDGRGPPRAGHHP